MVDAVCDLAHPWCIYISALCIDQFGQRYIKSTEVAPQGVYLAAQLTDVIEAFYRQHIDGCNKQHIVASGWIAIPNSVSLPLSIYSYTFPTSTKKGREPALELGPRPLTPTSCATDAALRNITHYRAVVTFRA